MRRKYDWKEIEKFYRKASDTGEKNPQSRTREKFNIPLATLNDRIKKHGWELSEQQSKSLQDFKETVPKLSENFRSANERQKDLIDEQVYTILEDNKITRNNRKFILAFQKIIGSSLADGDITIREIPSIMGAIEKMEKVSNPKPENIINNTNAQQNNIEPKGIDYFYDTITKQ